MAPGPGPGLDSALAWSATSEAIRAEYSACSGIRHIDSPAASPAAESPAASASELLNSAACRRPSPTVAAPVSVAMSTTTSAARSLTA